MGREHHLTLPWLSIRFRRRRTTMSGILESQPHRQIEFRNFRFELYASGEYSRMLETEWAANETRGQG